MTSQISLLPDTSLSPAGLQYQPDFISERDEHDLVLCRFSPSSSARSRASGAYPSRRFGGITTFTRAHGTSEARGEIVRDDIVVFEVMTDTLDRPWWESYRRRLEQSFSQDEILIRAVAIPRL